MTAITIRTGTNRSVKLDRPEINNKIDLKLLTSHLGENMSEIENSSETSPSKNETSVCETFQTGLSDEVRTTVNSESTGQIHNDEITDNVSDDLTLLARFVPKEGMPANDNDPSLSNSNDTYKEVEKHNSEIQNDQVKSNIFETNPLKALDVKNGIKFPTGEVSIESNEIKDDDKSDKATESETNGDQITTVLGSGYTPENDPDHSLLKFAVFEAQDLADEFKKLREFLDVMTNYEGFASPKEDESLCEDPATDHLDSVVSATDRADNLFDVFNEQISDEVGNPELAVTKNTSVTVAIDCKTQSEISFSSASFKSCDMNGCSDEVRSIKSFNQEIITAVK